MRGRRLIGAAAAAVAITVMSTVPAHATITLFHDHVDLLDVDWTGSALTLDLRDYAAGVDRNPTDVELLVKSSAKTTVPSGSQYAFLGNPGDPVWILPQGLPEATALDVLYLGWNSNGVTTNPPGPMTIHLVSVTGPDDFSAFTTGTFGTVTKLFDSGDGTPDTLPLALNDHKHANWAFEASGTYQVRLKVTAAGGITTGEKVYTFVVQP
jgi:surface-anchored protein